MGRKPKYSKEIKIRICKDYQNNKDTFESISKLIGTDYSSVRCWYLRYKENGASAFEPSNRNNSYS